MTTRTGLTLDQFLRLPETKPAREYADGEMTQKPMPTTPHGVLQGLVWALLLAYLRANRLGIAVLEWRCIFGPAGAERTFVPDIGVAVRAAQPHRSRDVEGHLYGPPDLAVEVLSPGQPAGAFADKLAFELLHGVRLVWVLDPEQENIRVFAPGQDPRLLVGEDVLDGGPVLPDFTLTVGALYADLREWLELMRQ